VKKICEPRTWRVTLAQISGSLLHLVFFSECKPEAAFSLTKLAYRYLKSKFSQYLCATSLLWSYL